MPLNDPQLHTVVLSGAAADLPTLPDNSIEDGTWYVASDRAAAWYLQRKAGVQVWYSAGGQSARTLDGWVRDGVAADLTDSEVVRWATVVKRAQVMGPGLLIGLGGFLDIAAAGAALTVTATLNGVATALTGTIAIGARFLALRGTGIAVVANDLVAITITTPHAWSATTAVFSGQLEVQE